MYGEKLFIDLNKITHESILQLLQLYKLNINEVDANTMINTFLDYNALSDEYTMKEEELNNIPSLITRDITYSKNKANNKSAFTGKMPKVSGKEVEIVNNDCQLDGFLKISGADHLRKDNSYSSKALIYIRTW